MKESIWRFKFFVTNGSYPFNVDVFGERTFLVRDEIQEVSHFVEPIDRLERGQ